MDFAEEWRSVITRPERCTLAAVCFALSLVLCAAARHWDKEYNLESELRGIFFRDNPHFIPRPSQSMWQKALSAFFDKKAAVSNRLGKLVQQGTSDEALEEAVLRELAKARREPASTKPFFVVPVFALILFLFIGSPTGERPPASRCGSSPRASRRGPHCPATTGASTARRLLRRR